MIREYLSREEKIIVQNLKKGELNTKKLLKITRYIRWTRAFNQQSKFEVEDICIYQNMESDRHSIFIWKWIASGFHPKKNPKQQNLKVVTSSDPSFSKKRIDVYDHAA